MAAIVNPAVRYPHAHYARDGPEKPSKGANVVRGKTITAGISSWERLKGHFTESFSGELLSSSGNDSIDERRVKRRRDAYRYYLSLIALIAAPLLLHNLLLREWIPAAGTVALMLVLVVNIAQLTRGREAPVSPAVVLLVAIGLVALALYFGQFFALFLMFPLMAALPVLVRSGWAAVLGIVSVAATTPLVLSRFDLLTSSVIAVALGLNWLISAWLVYAVTLQARRLHGMAITDPLTGAYNRRYLELQAQRALEGWDRYQRGSSLLLIDIDHFKRINDKYGHAVGDAALVRLVALIRVRIRKVDELYRFGGEEFAVMLDEANAELALRVAEDLVEAVRESQILPEGAMTISAGVCDLTRVRDVEHWFKLADGALYQAKSKGRNRVELAVARPLSVVTINKSAPGWR
ncbi:MAG: GGDEF domain-containing protein [Pseudomonadota bacterium]